MLEAWIYRPKIVSNRGNSKGIQKGNFAQIRKLQLKFTQDNRHVRSSERANILPWQLATLPSSLERAIFMSGDYLGSPSEWMFCPRCVSAQFQPIFWFSLNLTSTSFQNVSPYFNHKGNCNPYLKIENCNSIWTRVLF